MNTFIYSLSVQSCATLINFQLLFTPFPRLATASKPLIDMNELMMKRTTKKFEDNRKNHPFDFIRNETRMT